MTATPIRARNEVDEESGVERFFGVLVRKQSYLNILYLLLSFPLGLVYFVLLTVGLSLGLGLSLIGIGIPILFLMLAISRGLAGWERHLAIHLLGANIPPKHPSDFSWNHPWLGLKTLVGDPETWKGLAFLLARFPIGVFSFVVSLPLIMLTLALVLVPMAFQVASVNVGSWPINTSDAALVCFLLGLTAGLISIHLMNGLAAICRGFARMMLGPSQGVPHGSLKSGPILIP